MQKAVWGFVLGICLGGLIGWRSASGEKHDVAGKERVTKLAQTGKDRVERQIWGEAEFTEDALKNRDSHYGSKARGVEQWTDAELRAALDASLRHPDCASDDMYFGHDAVGILLGEWLRRDVDSVMAWFEKVQPEIAQRRMAWALDYFWPEADAEKGLAYFRAHPELKAGGVSTVFNKAVQLQALRGPQALAEFIAQASPEERRYVGINIKEMPAGFDFRTLMDSKVMQTMLDEKRGYGLLGQWMKQNPDQALSYLVEQNRANLILRMTSTAGTDREKSLTWIGSKLETLEEGVRNEIITQAKNESSYNPETLRALIDGVRDPQLQQTLRREGLGTIYRNGGTASALRFLNEIPLPEQRLELLETMQFPDSQQGGGGIPPSDETKLRQKLKEWNASDARIDAILGRLKKPVTLEWEEAH